MYESLTCFLPELLSTNEYGSWLVDTTGDGTLAHPYHSPEVDYSQTVEGLKVAAYNFAVEHPELGLADYAAVLREYGIDLAGPAVTDEQFANLDGRAVAALVIAATRVDRFVEGTMLSLLEAGQIQRWLARLQELDA